MTYEKTNQLNQTKNVRKFPFKEIQYTYRLKRACFSHLFCLISQFCWWTGRFAAAHCETFCWDDVTFNTSSNTSIFDISINEAVMKQWTKSCDLFISIFYLTIIFRWMKYHCVIKFGIWSWNMSLSQIEFMQLYFLNERQKTLGQVTTQIRFNSHNQTNYLKQH